MKSAAILLGIAVALGSGIANAGSDWSGPYIGIDAGWTPYAPGFGDRGYGSGTRDHQGDETGLTEHLFTSSGHAGYNMQRGDLVYGLELDYTSANGAASEAGDGVCGTGACGGGYAYRSRLKSMYSVRARLGVTVDKALFYGTAGVGRIEATHDYFDSSPYGKNKLNSNAFVVGLGTEYKVSEHWSARFEGLYYFATEKDVPTRDNFGERYTLDPSTVTVRVGLSYKF